MFLQQNYLVEDIFNLSKESQYQDVTIICHNGTFQFNSFLLATLFPIFREILNTSMQYDDSYIISMPDMDKDVFDDFWTNLYQKSPKFVPNTTIQQLLNRTTLLKEEIHEDEPDYSALDVEIGIEDNEDEKSFNFHHKELDALTLKFKKEETSSTIEQSINWNDISFHFDPETQKYKCPDCDHSAKYKAFLIAHYDRIHLKGESKRFECPIPDCTYFTVNKFSVKKHFGANHIHGEDPKFYKCQENNCNYSTDQGFNLKTHYEGKHLRGEKAGSCSICGLIPKSKHALIRHMKYKHSIEGKTTCETCHKSFPDEDFPKHECNQYICNDCGKILKSKGALENHIQCFHRINERSHICNVCGKGFTQASNLRTHIQTQHGSKKEPTPCPECGVKVKNLKCHMRFVHTPDDQRKHQCQHCGKGFDFLKSLDKHMMNMHLKLKPYNCRYGCDISYNDTSNRNHHERKRHGKLFISVEEEQMKAKMELLTKE